MILGDAIEIKCPDPDSHFRLRPCKVCQGENVAYVRYRAGADILWRVQCPDCGHMVGKGCEARHDAQVAWNREVAA